MSAVPQGSTLGPVMPNIFINVVDNGVECTLRKYENYTKLMRVEDAPEGHAAIQRADKNLMKFNKEKSPQANRSF